MKDGLTGGKLGSAIAVGALVVSAAAAHAACEPDKVAERYPGYAGKVVKAAASPTYRPFTYVKEDNFEEMTGLEVELIESIMECAGVELEWVTGKWSALLPTVFSGASDIMVGNVSFRPDRAEQGDFVTFMRNGQSVVVPKGNPNSVADADDLCGLTAAQSIGGSSALAMEEISKECVAAGSAAIEILPAEDQEAAFRQLDVGRVDAVMDGAAAVAARLNSETGGNFEVAFTVISDILAGVVTRNDNDEMLNILADGMQSMKESGELGALFDKYGMNRDLITEVEIRK